MSSYKIQKIDRWLQLNASLAQTLEVEKMKKFLLKIRKEEEESKPAPEMSKTHGSGHIA